jgi:hypothetical protein
MNNRIKEFAQQESDKEELVKLIVKTCMSLADLPANPSGQWDHLTPSQAIAKFFEVQV